MEVVFALVASLMINMIAVLYFIAAIRMKRKGAIAPVETVGCGEIDAEAWEHEYNLWLNSVPSPCVEARRGMPFTTFVAEQVIGRPILINRENSIDT